VLMPRAQRAARMTACMHAWGHLHDAVHQLLMFAYDASIRLLNPCFRHCRNRIDADGTQVAAPAAPVHLKLNTRPEGSTVRWRGDYVRIPNQDQYRPSLAGKVCHAADGSR
jgi:hypothetical protein